MITEPNISLKDLEVNYHIVLGEKRKVNKEKTAAYLRNALAGMKNYMRLFLRIIIEKIEKKRRKDS